MQDVFRKLRSMTFREAELRALTALTPLHPYLNRRLRETLANPAARAELNRRYLSFTPVEKAFFHALYSRAFREHSSGNGNGEWTVDFLGKRLKMPLQSETLWLDWDLASAITGHDIEVKLTYETLLRSEPKPRVFYDVGANYGTHSLLFLSQGLDVTAFEPNPACHRVFKRMCEINGLVANIEAAAVSDTPGKAEFWFPERDTWLGTMVGATRETLADEFELQKIEVIVTTLDDHVGRGGAPPDVIKIDTEGNEVKVLHGASRTIDSARPFIIFEANALGDRDELWRVLAGHGYVIGTLPVRDLARPSSLTAEEFRTSPNGNFIALPSA